MLPKIRIAHLPTPVETLPRLGAALGIHLLVKRDDQTGLALGGNKTRKLEYLMAEAQANGAHTIITAGAIQSNHCRQTAAAAARLGMKCILILVGEAPTLPDGNMMLDLLFGASFVFTTRNNRDKTLKVVFDQAWQAGQRPYLIPYGGSNAVGAAAYAYALKELLEQGVTPDWILFATSSGGTQAGLVAGAKLFGFNGQILGISVDEAENILKARVVDLAMQVTDLIGNRHSIALDEIMVNEEYLGGGYGVMGEAEREAIRMFASLEGLLVDPVYSGRAAAGLIDLARKKYFKPGETILFWHTGGTPALFSDRYQVVDG